MLKGGRNISNFKYLKRFYTLAKSYSKMAATKERRVIEEDLANVEFETSEDVEVRELYLPLAFLMSDL